MSGCGCGGGGSSTAIKGNDCGCGCGGEAAARGTAFVRPSFFGGMLLTEDDLQAALDYERAKRRLTNRYVLGAGVVCGLDVTCDPCDARKVVVAPGYAIECCGNDIVIDCAEPIDVIDLARALRQKLGKDCGEPCDQEGSAEYLLYVRYVEMPSDPVAPYAQDDCATGDCEFSRVREGYAFELRCEQPEAAKSLIDVLRACVPEDDDERDDLRQITEVVRIADAHARVMSVLAAGEQPIPRAPTKAEYDALDAPAVSLDAGVALVTRAAVVLAFDGAAAKGEAPSPGLNAERRALITTRTAELAKRLRDSDAMKALPAVDADRVAQVLDAAQQPASLATFDAAGRAWLAEGMTAEQAESVFVRGAQAMQQKVLQRVPGGCEQYRRVSAMRLGKLSTTSQADAQLLGQAYAGTVTSCVCSAFNPPCPTCTDDAVVLARVRVEACEVTDVCSLERQWVQSPRALAYWAPAIETFRRNLQAWCCGDDRKRREPLDATAQDLEEMWNVFTRAVTVREQLQ